MNCNNKLIPPTIMSVENIRSSDVLVQLSQTSPKGPSSSCTICGQQYTDRAEFKAHIKIHLKAKLNLKRENARKYSQSETQKTVFISTPSIMNFGTAASSNEEVMAELAACKPIPLSDNLSSAFILSNSLPSSISSMVSSPPGPLLHADQKLNCKKTENIDTCLHTPDISDIEDDIINYELKMSETDLPNDIVSILDQIEKDIDSTTNMTEFHDIKLETPPDSECENSDYLNSLFNGNHIISPTNHTTPFSPASSYSSASSSTSSSSTLLDNNNINNIPTHSGEFEFIDYLELSSGNDSINHTQTSCDKLDLDRLINETILSTTAANQFSEYVNQNSTPNLKCNSKNQSFFDQNALLQNHSNHVLKQSSLTAIENVDSLSTGKTLEVFNNKFLPSSAIIHNMTKNSRLVNVVKVIECVSAKSSSVMSERPCTIINIECRQPPSSHEKQSNHRQIIETYKAINTGSELKLIPTYDTSKNHSNSSAFLKNASSAAAASLAARINMNSSSAVASSLSSPATSVVNQQKPPVLKPYKISMIKSKSSSGCVICGKTITTKNMARHMEKHTGKKKFHCDICDSSFFQKTHLKNHTTLHKSNEYHKCSKCPQKFLRKSDFQKHIKNHSNAAKPYSVTEDNLGLLHCDICKLIFSDQAKLLNHKKVHFAEVNIAKLTPNVVAIVKPTIKHATLANRFKKNNEISSSYNNNKAVCRNNPSSMCLHKPFSCSMCCRQFTQKGHLNRHMKTHQNSSEQIWKTNGQSFVCHICFTRCKSNQSLIRHQAKHIACQLCCKLFVDQLSLVSHQRQEHLQKMLTSQTIMSNMDDNGISHNEETGQRVGRDDHYFSGSALQMPPTLINTYNDIDIYIGTDSIESDQVDLLKTDVKDKNMFDMSD